MCREWSHTWCMVSRVGRWALRLPRPAVWSGLEWRVHRQHRIAQTILGNGSNCLTSHRWGTFPVLGDRQSLREKNGRCMIWERLMSSYTLTWLADVTQITQQPHLCPRVDIWSIAPASRNRCLGEASGGASHCLARRAVRVVYAVRLWVHGARPLARPSCPHALCAELRPLASATAFVM